MGHKGGKRRPGNKSYNTSELAHLFKKNTHTYTQYIYLVVRNVIVSFFTFVYTSLLRSELERKEVAQQLEDWREQKRKIKLEAEQRLSEKIEQRRKEKVSSHS